MQINALFDSRNINESSSNIDPFVTGIFTSFSPGHFGIYKLKGNTFSSSTSKSCSEGMWMNSGMCDRLTMHYSSCLKDFIESFLILVVNDNYSF